MHILLTVLSAVYLSISVAEAICYPIKISMRSLEQGFIDLGQFLILSAMYLAWNRKALKVDGVFGKVFQNAALICFFISSYLIFFNDTIINKLGIKIDADSNYYKYICGMGTYVMLLYILSL